MFIRFKNKKKKNVLIDIPDNPCTTNYCANGGSCKLNSYGDPVCSCLGDWIGALCSGKTHEYNMIKLVILLLINKEFL